MKRGVSLGDGAMEPSPHQRRLQYLRGLAFLRGGDVAVDLGRRLRRGVPEQLLGDAWVDTGTEEQGGSATAQVVEPQLRQTGYLE